MEKFNSFLEQTKASLGRLLQIVISVLSLKEKAEIDITEKLNLKGRDGPLYPEVFFESLTNLPTLQISRMGGKKMKVEVRSKVQTQTETKIELKTEAEELKNLQNPTEIVKTETYEFKFYWPSQQNDDIDLINKIPEKAREVYLPQVLEILLGKIERDYSGNEYLVWKILEVLWYKEISNNCQRKILKTQVCNHFNYSENSKPFSQIVLLFIANDDDEKIRYLHAEIALALGSNPDKRLISSLAKSPHHVARGNIAAREDLDPEIIKDLLDDPNRQVKRQAELTHKKQKIPLE